jgi:hypothetical protein
MAPYEVILRLCGLRVDTRNPATELSGNARKASRPGPLTSAFELRLLGISRPLGPLVAWLLRRQATSDLCRLKHILEPPPTTSGPAP